MREKIAFSLLKALGNRHEMTITKIRQSRRKLATVVTMATLMSVDSHVTHLLLLFRNMQLDPVSSQMHFEHNLPVVPSAQIWHKGEISETPDSRIS